MSSKPITLVTGNANKLKEIIKILGSDFPRQIISKDIDLLEIQGSPDEVATAKCKEAAKVINGPVLVEDTALCMKSLNDLPGVYIKWFLKALTAENLHKLLAGFEDKSTYALCTFAYCEKDGEEVKIFRGKTPGMIVEARGPRQFGWDPCFLPDGFDKTYAELDSDVKNSISHRRRALEELKAYFS
ncbi:unnamed protein product [Dimorphilus gyrociliatus]|uniref:Inosine triphosphate pyrophosphatase n=1 Tax=Dimorphilus gyrociliatus TaxID=2664684 RepID=A0A7I8V5T8_9ANNE|nr:unnamed protein product [Dimorphilus gyrociliatus]